MILKNLHDNYSNNEYKIIKSYDIFIYPLNTFIYRIYR